MGKKVTTYKGFKIVENIDLTGKPIFKVYTKEDWANVEGVRCYEWEACSMKEATDFVDLYEQGVIVKTDNFIDYSEVTGFRLFKEGE